MQAYLDAGGKLFITGQNIAESLSWSDRGFLSNYLHATFRQADTGLYALSGAAGDPIGDGLALNISGGDGANDQYSKDEVDPIAPAEVVFTYRAGVSAMLAEPIRPAEEAPSQIRRLTAESPKPSADCDPLRRSRADCRAAASCRRQRRRANVGSGTAGLRVDTGKYKVVYFAFGFEAINSAADRQAVHGAGAELARRWPASEALSAAGLRPAFGGYFLLGGSLCAGARGMHDPPLVGRGCPGGLPEWDGSAGAGVASGVPGRDSRVYPTRGARRI